MHNNPNRLHGRAAAVTAAASRPTRVAAALRVSRSAAAMRLEDIAAACGVAIADLRQHLERLDSCGGCAALAAAAAAENPAIQCAALARRCCPPHTKRLTAPQSGDAAGWAHRFDDIEDRHVSGPRRFIAGAAAAEFRVSSFCEAASNPLSPAGLLARCAADPEWHVRVETANNPSCDSQILAELAADTESIVRIMAQTHPNWHPSTIA